MNYLDGLGWEERKTRPLFFGGGELITHPQEHRRFCEKHLQGAHRAVKMPECGRERSPVFVWGISVSWTRTAHLKHYPAVTVRVGLLDPTTILKQALNSVLTVSRS